MISMIRSRWSYLTLREHFLGPELLQETGMKAFTLLDLKVEPLQLKINSPAARLAD